MIFPGHWRKPQAIMLLHPSGYISFDAMNWLAEQDIPLINFDWNGEQTSVLTLGHITDRSIHLKNLQREIADCPIRSLAVSNQLISDKLGQCVKTLEKLKVADAVVTILGCMVELKHCHELTMQYGVEGKAAFLYFKSWRDIPITWATDSRHPIPKDWYFVGPRHSKIGRKRGNRNATQPVNAMLNYGYAVLEGYTKLSVIASGLDPNIGFMHGQGKNKGKDRNPFVLDMMEPMRPVIDAAVLGYVKSKTMQPEDFTIVRNSPLFPSGIVRLKPKFASKVAKLSYQALTDNPLLSPLNYVSLAGSK